MPGNGGWRVGQEMGACEVDNVYEGVGNPAGVEPAYLGVVSLGNFEPARPVALEGRDAGRDPYARYTMLFVKEAGSRRAGASAFVYKVMNSDTEFFALKRLRPTTEEGTLENDVTLGRSARDAFDEEYRTQLDLSNLPCFPQVFGRGTIEGDPAILMEWVEGVTLESARETLGTEVGPGGELCAPASTVASLGVAVLGALQLAGRLNRPLVHRDISPRNIMLRTDRRPVSAQIREWSFDVCLIDFGSSALVDEGRDAGFTRRTGEWRWGTPEYAPPEMLTNHIPNARELRRDQRVDVYALCSVLYELYSGHTPYRLAERGLMSDEFSIVKERETPHPLLARSPRDQGLVDAIMAGIRAEQSERIGVSELSARLVSWLAELDPSAPAAPQAAEPAKPAAEPVKLDDSLLSDAEKQAVEDFAKKIDITDSNMILQYGAAAQKNVAGFSENALNSVRTKDLGEVGKSLSELVVELKGFGEEEEKKGLFGLFKKTGSKLEAMKAQYAKVETNVDKIARELEQHQVTLLKDVAMLDQMYELNLKYYKELTMYILAGKKKLEQVRAQDLPALKAKAEQTGAQEDAQAYNDLAQMCERFEKKLHDLELTRIISVQMGPQTRLIQNNDTLMVEKIQSSLVNTIPLWKSQMVLALGLEHSRQATAAQSAVTEMTNELLKKNADMLKMGTVATAREAERSVVDIETLQHTNAQLISTLDEVLNIQKEGAAKRKAAEAELGRIEGELKQKLMELRN